MFAANSTRDQSNYAKHYPARVPSMLDFFSAFACEGSEVTPNNEELSPEFGACLPGIFFGEQLAKQVNLPEFAETCWPKIFQKFEIFLIGKVFYRCL